MNVWLFEVGHDHEVWGVYATAEAAQQAHPGTWETRKPGLLMCDPSPWGSFWCLREENVQGELV